MKFEDVRNLYRQLDSANNWDDDDHMYMQAYSQTKDELLVVRLGGGKQSYLYRLPVGSVPSAYIPLKDGIPICTYEDGVLYAGKYYYDLPDEPEPYNPDSIEAGVLDVDMNGDWKLSDVDHIKAIAEDQLGCAAYEFECAKKALETLINN